IIDIRSCSHGGGGSIELRSVKEGDLLRGNVGLNASCGVKGKCEGRGDLFDLELLVVGDDNSFEGVVGEVLLVGDREEAGDNAVGV
ncbi:2907_t:CDS:2, partial [Entrophospora sp. SA101]